MSRRALTAIAALGIAAAGVAAGDANARDGQGRHADGDRIEAGDGGRALGVPRAERRRARSRSGQGSEEPGEPGQSDDAANDPSALRRLDGFVPATEISYEVRLAFGKSPRRDAERAVAIQRARGGIETGLEPVFEGDAPCPRIDSETWALDYSHKRSVPSIHKGVDIPQPRGTPVRAVADGTVVGRFMNSDGFKGIEVVLRHTPEQTGLPYYTYSQYTHLLEMSPLAIGTAVRTGQEVGKTSNTGRSGRRARRDALHFGIFYSTSPRWTNNGAFVVPEDGYLMDPNAFYRAAGPFDSPSLARLPAQDKQVRVPYLRADGRIEPEGARRIWPYACP